MNKKTIIQVAIIICAFGLSGIIVYRGLFANKNSAPSPALSTAGSVDISQAAEPILPNGGTWDLDQVLNKQKQLQFGIVQFPQLNASADVGVSYQELFAPLSGGK